MSIFFKKHHRQALLRQPFPDQWEAIIRADVVYDRLLDDAQSRHLRDLTRIIIDEKHWEGCGGLEVDDRIKVVIAAQAAVLFGMGDGRLQERTNLPDLSCRLPPGPGTGGA